VPKSHCRIDQARCRASGHEPIRPRVSTRGCPRQRTSMPGTRSSPNTGVAVSRAPSHAMDTAIASRRASRGISATGQVWPVHRRPCAQGAVRAESWIVSTMGSISDDPHGRRWSRILQVSARILVSARARATVLVAPREGLREGARRLIMTNHGTAVSDHLMHPGVRARGIDRERDVSLSRRDAGASERAGEQR
jgi:hypothetical protein